MSDIFLSATVRPGGPFPITEDVDTKGGYRVVADHATRDAIILGNRKQGMLVRTLNDGQTWVLNSDASTWSAFTAGNSTLDATDVTYTPAVSNDWGNLPSFVNDALDTLATTSHYLSLGFNSTFQLLGKNGIDATISTSAGNGAGVLIKAGRGGGDHAPQNGGGRGGDLTVSAGDSGANNSAGKLQLNAGNGGGNRAGLSGQGSGPGGDIIVNAGIGSEDFGGNGGDNGGSLKFWSGSGGPTHHNGFKGGDTGNIEFRCGNFGFYDGSSGGNISFLAADGGHGTSRYPTSGNGGVISFTSGSAGVVDVGGSNGGQAGDITFTSGNGSNGTSTALGTSGGNITFQSGNAGADGGAGTREPGSILFSVAGHRVRYLYVNQTVQTSSYTAKYNELVRVDPTGGAFAITLPSATGVGIPADIASATIIIKNQSDSSNVVTISPIGGETIDGSSSIVLNAGRQSITFVSDGTSDWMVV